MKFLPYNPEQAYLLPPRVADVLGKEHLCFFLRRVVDRLDLNSFEEAYEDEGRPAYAPEPVGGGVAVRLCAGGDLVAAAGAAGAGGFGVPLLGGRGDAGFLDAEPVSSAARAGAQRSVHASGGVGARRRGWDAWGM